jgi:hypothetical protein
MGGPYEVFAFFYPQNCHDSGRFSLKN